tara:strand:- start:527 stop:1726 length:1200 start_codon:yes stop_codon:yes gene_type:complete
MKKPLLILICLPLLFTTCKKEESEKVLPCLCENIDPFITKSVNIEKQKDKKNKKHFSKLTNELNKAEKIKRHQTSSTPFLRKGGSAFIYSNDTICRNTQDPAEVSVLFTGESPFTFVYSINGDPQLPITTTANPHIMQTKQEGYYSLVSFSDINGTGDVTGQGIVTVLDPPVADFITQPDTITILSPSTQCLDMSIGDVVSWGWSFGDGNFSDSQNPYHTYADNTNSLYQIILVIEDASGCSDTAEKIITINDVVTMYVPNAFTPDNDNINDVFCLSYHGVREQSFYINVYDRFSNLVYTNTNIEELECGFLPQKGWDGTHYLTGNELPTGVYTYVVYYQDFEGWNRQKDGKISMIRDVNNISNHFSCYPQRISNCRFGDMIDPLQGFIFPTQEDINNW